MRIHLLFIGLCAMMFVSAQDSLVSAVDSTSVEWVNDSFDNFHRFNPDTIQNHKQRLIAMLETDPTEDWYFYGLMIYSLVLVFFYLSSKDMVLASFKSFYSYQFNVQYNRTNKQRNLLYLLIYYLLFILAFVVLAQFILHTFFDSNISWARLTGLCFAYFIWDYFSTNIYHLFTSNSKGIDLVKSVQLVFSPLWALLIWLALFFVILGSAKVSGIASVLSISLLAFMLLAKEIRILQVLWLEKIDIFSFHFFAYLCTFKILPFILLVKLVF